MQGKLRRLSKEEVRAVDKELDALIHNAVKRLKKKESTKEEVLRELISVLKIKYEQMGMVRTRRAFDELEAVLDR